MLFQAWHDCILTPVRRFSEAIRAGRISKVEKISECCILAAVGQQMASRKGVAATMFSALAKANINIRCAALHYASRSVVHATTCTCGQLLRRARSLWSVQPVAEDAQSAQAKLHLCQGVLAAALHHHTEHCRSW